MIVVSDTTPIISLIKVGKISLLKELFTEVIIPEAVYRELITNTSFIEEAEIVKTSDFLKVVKVQNVQSLKLLQQLSGLDAGESEAIILFDELKSNLLIMDERKGRKVAGQLGITLTGTVGILIQSYNENLLSADEVETCLQTLKNSNIRLSEKLLNQALNMLK